MRTTFMAKGHEVERKWLVVDAEGQTLGRLASEIASILRGKHKPTFTPNVDTGDFVIVINADKIHLTGNKLEGKIYYRHTQFAGGLKTRTAGEMKEKYP
ncbi:MAG TPA: 50S ribosomal protein L13, partial [Ureibacillus sp.]|nr:50S ribosomal protein L13 [Ureibacillus sp.]